VRRGGRERTTPDLILNSGAEVAAVTGGIFSIWGRWETPSLVLRAAAAVE
jgi:hypothetical protein